MVSSEFGPNGISTKPLNGIFAGKDILTIEQLDQKSFDRLNSQVELLEELLQGYRRSTLLRHVIVVSAVDSMAIGNYQGTVRKRFPFEAAVSRLGGKILNQELPSPEDPMFDYKILDIKASLPDAVLISHPNQELVQRAANVFQGTIGKIPIINTSIFEDPKVETCGALVALTLGKI